LDSRVGKDIRPDFLTCLKLINETHTIIVFTAKAAHYLLNEDAVSWKLLFYDPYISFLEAELLIIPCVLLKYRS
jgi:hypothetical protein